jgi:hypothetical protein
MNAAQKPGFNFTMIPGRHQKHPVLSGNHPSLENEPDPTDLLSIWVIYDHPEDYPDHWVVRRQQIQALRQDIATYGLPILCQTLDEARQRIPPGRTRIVRHPQDVPCIYETWI